MNVTINGTNDAPNSADDTAVVIEDTARTLAVADFGNVSDVDSGDSLKGVKITALPLHGTLTLSGGAVAADQVIAVADVTAGNLVYTPAGNDDTDEALTFKVVDQADAESAAYTLTLDITPVNDAPVTTPVTLAPIAEDSGVRVITQAELLANASDVDDTRPAERHRPGHRHRRRLTDRQRRRHLDLHPGAQRRHGGELQLHRQRRRPDGRRAAPRWTSRRSTTPLPISYSRSLRPHQAIPCRTGPLRKCHWWIPTAARVRTPIRSPA